MSCSSTNSSGNMHWTPHPWFFPVTCLAQGAVGHLRLRACRSWSGRLQGGQGCCCIFAARAHVPSQNVKGLDPEPPSSNISEAEGGERFRDAAWSGLDFCGRYPKIFAVCRPQSLEPSAGIGSLPRHEPRIGGHQVRISPRPRIERLLGPCLGPQAWKWCWRTEFYS